MIYNIASPVVMEFLLVVHFLQNTLLFRNVWFNFAPFFNSCIKFFGGALHHLPIITGIIGGALHHVNHVITTGLSTITCFEICVKRYPVRETYYCSVFIL